MLISLSIVWRDLIIFIAGRSEMLIFSRDAKLRAREDGNDRLRSNVHSNFDRKHYARRSPTVNFNAISVSIGAALQINHRMQRSVSKYANRWPNFSSGRVIHRARDLLFFSHSISPFTIYDECSTHNKQNCQATQQNCRATHTQTVPQFVIETGKGRGSPSRWSAFLNTKARRLCCFDINFIQLLNGDVNEVECAAEANKLPQNFALF